MERPDQVELVGQPFVVQFVDESDDGLSKGDVIGVGRVRLTRQRILIAERLAERQERDTLLHEVLHGLFGLVGLISDDSEEERIVGTLTPLLLDTLRRNPQLVEYLVAA